MIQLLDKFFILFIYSNILVNGITLYNIQLSKLLFTIMMLLYVIYLLKSDEKLCKRSLNYIFLSISFIALLSLISSLLHNSLSDILEFVFSVFVILLIPYITTLFKYFDTDRYVNHILLAIVMLSIYTLILYLYFIRFDTWNPEVYLINETKSLGTVLIYWKGLLQVHLVSGGWFPIGMIILYYKCQYRFRLMYLIIFVLLFFSIFVSYTMALWISTAVALIILSFIFRRWHVTIAICLITILVLALTPGQLVDAKIESVIQKSTQTEEAVKIFNENMLFGKGLGYVYNKSEIGSISGDSGNILEVSYAMILSSTGLIGVLVYSFIFLFYPFIFIFLKDKRTETKLFIVAFVTVLIEAVGNPYIWGGGLALFLMSLLAASIEMSNKHQLFMSNLIREA